MCRSFSESELHTHRPRCTDIFDPSYNSRRSQEGPRPPLTPFPGRIHSTYRHARQYLHLLVPHRLEVLSQPVQLAVIDSHIVRRLHDEVRVSEYPAGRGRKPLAQGIIAEPVDETKSLERWGEQRRVARFGGEQVYSRQGSMRTRPFPHNDQGATPADTSSTRSQPTPLGCPADNSWRRGASRSTPDLRRRFPTCCRRRRPGECCRWL
ncbi:hypothetical protein K466DRAFT_314233 [Polyporus arcularius HHB13444]|uniref:Uncharacterized protein n=1 Tax=Polyporus arcularius HHB13444 TaxID=1314778 RepID=A0A5C3PQ72_9APHY|nr:hypothetical protein K466DRAFT_314233 [Polyporus arcularius HHB13444]